MLLQSVTHKLTTLRSTQDPSVNIVEQRLVGFLESRYVRRSPDYFACYLSSHSGCNRGCAMCHLTVTGQTSFEPADRYDFLEQARRVFAEYDAADATQRLAKRVHFNFMARGEPLANPTLLTQGDDLFYQLGTYAASRELSSKFCISTIMPQTLRKSLHEVFRWTSPTIYYSLYSISPVFRAKWLPMAMPPEQALAMLAEWQLHSKKIVKLHHALIDGENDSIDDALNICEAVDKHSLICEFNLVRYNPATLAQGVESPDAARETYLRTMRVYLLGRVKEVTRVGLDVKASCGTFVSEES